MPAEPLTAALVREALAQFAGLEIDEAEAAAVLPLIEAQRRSMAIIERFDVGEVYSAVLYDATAP